MAEETIPEQLMEKSNVCIERTTAIDIDNMEI